jgi:hypothetical protein
MPPTATKRRARVLIKSPEVTARMLRANPGVWFLIGIGDPDEDHTLEQVARVLTQTAWRIRQNYRPNDRGVPQGLKAFADDPTGEFEAQSTADQSRPDKLAAVELLARWMPRTP